MKNEIILIGLVDDHQLFLKSLSLMLAGMPEVRVVLEAVNGSDMIEKLRQLKDLPDIILLDVNMPVMDGLQTAKWLRENYTQIKVVALSMNDADKAILGMLREGCCAYMLKDIHPTDLETAIREIQRTGFYNGDATHRIVHKVLKAEKAEIQLNDNELEFLRLACSNLTYKEIAGIMHKSERTIDGYRETLFRKFEVQSRVGLCLEAIRKDFVKL